VKYRLNFDPALLFVTYFDKIKEKILHLAWSYTCRVESMIYIYSNIMPRALRNEIC